MNDRHALTETHLELPLFSRGKVRDTYELDAARLLMVTTDRISAFDYVLPTGIPDRGRVLTQLSVFWFGRTADVVENHLLADSHDGLPAELAGRCMVVRRAQRIDYECVVRGYLAGSAWSEYRQSGTMAGEALPRACARASACPSRSSRRPRSRMSATTRTSRSTGCAPISARSWPVGSATPACASTPRPPGTPSSRA